MKRDQFLLWYRLSRASKKQPPKKNTYFDGMLFGLLGGALISFSYVFFNSRLNKKPKVKTNKHLET